jgi:hypothetical protein
MTVAPVLMNVAVAFPSTLQNRVLHGQCHLLVQFVRQCLRHELRHDYLNVGAVFETKHDR